MYNTGKGGGLCWGWSLFALFSLHCLFSTTINSWLYLYVVIMSHTWFEGESTLYSCLNVKELLAYNRSNIWSLSDRNGIRTQNHLAGKRTLDHFRKTSLAKWLSVCLRTKLLWVRIPQVLTFVIYYVDEYLPCTEFKGQSNFLIQF